MSKIIQLDQHKKPKLDAPAKAFAWLIIEANANPENGDGWVKVMPADIPDWVKDQEVITKMMEGLMVCADPNTPCNWYRAVRVVDGKPH